jgi:DNA-binding Xre family transcriptional regulator
MLRCRLKDIAQARGYPNVKQLTEALNEEFEIQMSRSALYPYWNDQVENFNRQTVDRLCTFLRVPAGLLIEHIHPDCLKKKK